MNTTLRRVFIGVAIVATTVAAYAEIRKIRIQRQAVDPVEWEVEIDGGTLTITVVEPTDGSIAMFARLLDKYAVDTGESVRPSVFNRDQATTHWAGSGSEDHGTLVQE